MIFHGNETAQQGDNNLDVCGKNDNISKMTFDLIFLQYGTNIDF